LGTKVTFGGVVAKNRSSAYEPIELETLLNVLLALLPIWLMAVKHTTTIRASITAYTTAVGPSSQKRKVRIR